MSSQYIDKQLNNYFDPRQIFCQIVQPVAGILVEKRKETQMITTSSKNNSFICVEGLCDDQICSCSEHEVQMEPQVHPLKKFLGDLWIHFLLFLGTDRWEEMASLKVGDSHYMMRMDDIQNRWRHM